MARFKFFFFMGGGRILQAHPIQKTEQLNKGLPSEDPLVHPRQCYLY